MSYREEFIIFDDPGKWEKSKEAAKVLANCCRGAPEEAVLKSTVKSDIKKLVEDNTDLKEVLEKNKAKGHFIREATEWACDSFTENRLLSLKNSRNPIDSFIWSRSNKGFFYWQRLSKKYENTKIKKK